MTKIKGWDKIAKGKWKNVFKTSSNTHTTLIDINEDGVMHIYKYEGQLLLVTKMAKFKTRTSAMNYAINYMKKHPRGEYVSISNLKKQILRDTMKRHNNCNIGEL